MKRPWQEAERDHAVIEDAAYDTVHYSCDPRSGRPLTVGAIATDINVRAATLQDAADANRDQPFHLSWVVPIIKRTQNYAIVRFIARAVGGVFIKLPEHNPGRANGLVTVIGDVMKEVADVVTIAGQALAGDGLVDAAEQSVLLQQIAEAKTALVVAEQLVMALPTDPLPKDPGRRRDRR